MDSSVFALLGVGGVISLGAVSSLIKHRRLAASENLIDVALTTMGLTPADIDDPGLEVELREAQSRCCACSIASRCRRSLVRPLAARVPTDCPNLVLMDAITRHRIVKEPRTRRPKDIDSSHAHSSTYTSSRDHWVAV